MYDLHLFSAIDKAYMRRCISLAKKGEKATHTNPMVGCIIVSDDKIIGEGYHKRYGGAHAEVEAFNNISTDNLGLIANSTLYVTLEPCSHLGKTPPCAHMIVSMGIKKVYIGSIDPNPLVSGQGVEVLKSAGIDVQVGLLHDETDLLIAKFKTNLKLRPYVILKWAKSADNYLGIKGVRTQLSNPVTNILVHRWRSEVDAILVGKNTVIVDDPSLTVRNYEGDNPIRFVLDSKLALSEDYKVFDDSVVTYLVNSLEENLETQPRKLKFEDPKDIKSILGRMFDLGITSIIVEGGAEVLKSFVEANLWDEARIISTTKLLKDGVPAPNLDGKLIETFDVRKDTIHIIRNKNII